jgi:predicted permease
MQLETLRGDAILAWRRLSKQKIASGAAVLSLALGIGACTAAFRLVDALFWRPLPITAPERLWVIRFESIGADGTRSTYDSGSYPMFRQMRDDLKDQATLMAVSYAERVDVTFGTNQDSEKVQWQFVSGSMFPAFGIRPVVGRLLVEDDDVTPGARPYAVLSYDYWTRRFGRDPAVLGRTFHVAETAYQVIGVAAAPFTGTETGVMTDVFVPMMMKNARTLASPANFWLRTLVQVKPGVDPSHVHARMLASFRPINADREEKLMLEPAPAGSSNLQRDYRTSLIALGALVGLMLLIACANVANLMTAQSAARSREMALRVSIGAGRARLMQLVLVESALIAAMSVGLGSVFAWWAAPLVVSRINPLDNPARLMLATDWRVLAFSVVVTLIVTCLFGLTPAWRASGVRPMSALKGGEDPRGHRRMMHGVIAAQVAFCALVLVVSGLLVRTFDRLSNLPLGFSAARVLNLDAVARPAQAPAWWRHAAEQLRAAPGVESVALIEWPLMSGESRVTNLAIAGKESAVPSDVLRVSPGWLETMRIPLTAGRDFRADEAFPATAIVNDAFAKQYFDGANPVGRTFDIRSPEGAPVQVQIVGLVADARSRDRMRRAILPTAYFPFQAADATGAPQAATRGTFVVRTSNTNPLTMASTLRQEISRAHAGFRVTNVRTQTAINQAPLLRERLLSMLALFFSAVALIVAGIGLYGVLDYTVLQRRREIGIRLALGAQRHAIARNLTSDVLSMVLLGLIGGVIVALASARYIETLFYQVKVTDPVMLIGPSAALLTAVLIAALPSVVRATQQSLITTLRE